MVAQIHLRARGRAVDIQGIHIALVAAKVAVAVLSGAGKLALRNGRSERRREDHARVGEQGRRVAVDPQRGLARLGDHHGHVLRVRPGLAGEVGDLRRDDARPVAAVGEHHMLAVVASVEAGCSRGDGKGHGSGADQGGL